MGPSVYTLQQRYDSYIRSSNAWKDEHEEQAGQSARVMLCARDQWIHFTSQGILTTWREVEI
jgi:hypothetical protein